MGDLLVKNWKKILIFAGIVILAILLYCKITWKPNIIEDYRESDIVIERDVIDGIKDTSKDISEDAKENIDKANEEASGKNGSRSIVGWAIILGVAFFAILLLDMLMQPSGDKKKKK